MENLGCVRYFFTVVFLKPYKNIFELGVIIILELRKLKLRKTAINKLGSKFKAD